VADLYNAYSRLDTRTLRYAALVNRESSCGLSSVEMVASDRGWGIGYMDERQDWPIAALFLYRRSRQGRLGRETLAVAWLTALGKETECWGEGGSMHSTISFLVPLGLQ
jgi:hypothetical protein